MAEQDNKTTVVMCEDEESLRASVKMTLEYAPMAAGRFKIIECKSGEEGLAAIVKMTPAERANAILLTDNDMEKTKGVIKGIDLIKKVRQDSPEMGTVIMTGRIMRDESGELQPVGHENGLFVSEIKALGVPAVPKPFKTADLVDALDKAIDDRQTGKAQSVPGFAARQEPPKGYAADIRKVTGHDPRYRD